jgi:hypothetical protein
MVEAYWLQAHQNLRNQTSSLLDQHLMLGHHVYWKIDYTDDYLLRLGTEMSHIHPSVEVLLDLLVELPVRSGDYTWALLEIIAVPNHRLSEDYIQVAEVHIHFPVDRIQFLRLVVEKYCP